MTTSTFFRRCFIVLVLASVLQACSRGPSAADRFADSLSGVFERSAGAGKVVRIAEVTDFEWDRMFVFPPKSSLKHIFETLDRPVHYDIHQTHIFERDDINVLVFFRGDSIAEVVALDRARLDISVPDGVGALSPGDAVFSPSLAERALVLAGSPGLAR